MNTVAVQAKLAELLTRVSREADAHPDRWYPTRMLEACQRDLARGISPQECLSYAHIVRYLMIDAFHDYTDEVFGLILGFMVDFGQHAAVEQVLTSLTAYPESNRRVEAMQQLVHAWNTCYLAQFPPAGAEQEEWQRRFAEHYRRDEAFWMEIIPRRPLQALLPDISLPPVEEDAAPSRPRRQFRGTHANTWTRRLPHPHDDNGPHGT